MTTIWSRYVAAANPERMVTFTKIGETRQEINAGLQHILRDLRGDGYEFQYWGTVELHKSLKPHMHLLQKGGYIPKDHLAHTARRHGWGWTDIRKIRSGWSAVRYCAKHLCHSHGRRWDGRLVRYSRKFFAGVEREKYELVDGLPIKWKCVFGRADFIGNAMEGQGFRVVRSDLGLDWVMGDAKVGENIERRVARSESMGYRDVVELAQFLGNKPRGDVDL